MEEQALKKPNPPRQPTTREIVLDWAISPKACKLALVIREFTKGSSVKGWAISSVRNLAKEGQMGKHAVETGLTELASVGVLEVEKLDPDNDFSPMKYRLREERSAHRPRRKKKTPARTARDPKGKYKKYSGPESYVLEVAKHMPEIKGKADNKDNPADDIA